MSEGAVESRVHEQPGARFRPSFSVSSVIAVAVVAGLVLRIWVLASKLGPADSDEAVVGLMARHLLHGHASFFYWGQAYGGSVEQAPVALLYWLFGTSSMTMKAVAVAAEAIAAVLVWRIGFRVGGARVGRLAGALFWLGPAEFVWLSTKENGFYGGAIVLSLVVVFEALRVYERPTKLDAAVFGLAAGLGWYATAQTLFVFVPLGVWLVVVGIRERRADLLRSLQVAVPAAVVGALPWLVAAVRNHGASLRLPIARPPTTYLHRLGLVYTTGFPISLGVRVPYSGSWLVPVLGRLAYVALVVLLIAGVVDWLRGARRIAMPAFLVLALIVLYPFVEAIPRTSAYLIEPRYLYLWSPFVALFLAILLARYRDWVQVTALVIVGVLSVAGIASMIRWGEKYPANYDLISADDGPLLRMLDANGVRSVFTDYWFAYRIDLDSHERITAASLSVIRYNPYQTAVRESERPAYVTMDGSPLDASVKKSLDALGIGYKRAVAGTFVMYVPGTRVLPEQLALTF